MNKKINFIIKTTYKRKFYNPLTENFVAVENQEISPPFLLYTDAETWIDCFENKDSEKSDFRFSIEKYWVQE